MRLPPNGLEFAEHPVGEPPGQPCLVSRQSQTLGWPGSVEDPRPSGCFAKRSGGGSIELLGILAVLGGVNRRMGSDWGARLGGPYGSLIMVRSLDGPRGEVHQRKGREGSNQEDGCHGANEPQESECRRGCDK